MVGAEGLTYYISRKYSSLRMLQGDNPPNFSSLVYFLKADVKRDRVPMKTDYF